MNKYTNLKLIALKFKTLKYDANSFRVAGKHRQLMLLYKNMYKNSYSYTEGQTIIYGRSRGLILLFAPKFRNISDRTTIFFVY